MEENEFCFVQRKPKFLRILIPLTLLLGYVSVVRYGSQTPHFPYSLIRVYVSVVRYGS